MCICFYCLFFSAVSCSYCLVFSYATFPLTMCQVFYLKNCRNSSKPQIIIPSFREDFLCCWRPRETISRMGSPQCCFRDWCSLVCPDALKLGCGPWKFWFISGWPVFLGRNSISESQSNPEGFAWALTLDRPWTLTFVTLAYEIGRKAE